MSRQFAAGMSLPAAGEAGAERQAGRRFTVGLTGGIASGKSLASNRLAALGAAVVDTDVISREQTAAGMPALDDIAREFGPHLIAADRSLDRAALRALVFSDPGARKRLEAILHPRIRAACWQRAGETPGSYLVMVIPLLAETGFTGRIDRVLVIDAPRELQLKRLRKRDGATFRQARAILAAQATRRQRRALANDLLLNDGGRKRLLERVDRLHGSYLGMAQTHGGNPG